MSMETKNNSSKQKPFKVIAAILAFIFLAYLSEALISTLFLFFVFVLIFRFMIQHKEKTGSWPVKFATGYPCCYHHSSFNRKYIPSVSVSSPDYDMNPLNSGGAAAHMRRRL